MYWHPKVHSLLDVRILIREQKTILQQRRTGRNDRIAEDSFWKDPPGIFDNIVWPAYSDAHLKLFEDGDIEKGQIEAETGITLLEASELSIDEMVDRTCAEILKHVSKSVAARNV